MKRDNELVILVVLSVLMYINPSIVARCVNNILGKIVALGCIVYLAERHTILGLLLAVIFIASLQSGTEGMTAEAAGASDDDGSSENGNDASGEDASASADDGGKNGGGEDNGDSDGASTDKDKDKDDDSKNGKTDKKKKSGSEGFAKLSPATISSGRELIGLENMMRPADSNELPFSRPRGTPPSENLLAGQLDMMSPITFDGTMSRNFLPAIF